MKQLLRHTAIAPFCYSLLLLICFTQKTSAQTITSYSFSSTSGTFATLPAGIAPALTAGTTDEGYFNAIPVGFDFWYMGVRYTSISASTNGWLALGADITNASPVNNLASGGTPRPLIAPLWDDLDIQAATNVTYQTTGTAGSRIFTIQYLNAKWQSTAGGNTISFQAKIYEANGKIEFIYRPEAAAVTAASASIGIAATGTGNLNYYAVDGTGTAPAANAYYENSSLNSKPASGQTYAFTPPAPTAAPSTLAFSAITTSTTTLNWVDNSSNENGFVIYRSADGGATYSFISQTAANATSSIQTGLTGGTTYYYKVYAVTEGVLSTALSGSRITLCTAAAPTVTTPVNLCQNATATALTATGTNLLWGGAAGSVGGTTALATGVYVDNGSNNRKTNFTTTAANVIISTVDYYIPAWQSVSGLVLSIYNNSGTVVATSSTTTSASAGASAVKVTSTFNYTVAVAGAYSIGVSAGTGNIGSDSPTFPITETTGTINVTGVSAVGYRCFNNIQFTTTSSTTAPIPSTATIGSKNYYVTQTVAGCISPQVTITVNVTSPTISMVPAANLIASYKFNGNAIDATNTNNGTLQGSPTLVPDRFNNAGKAYSFNGSSQYMSTATPYLNPQNFTVSIWFKTNTTTGGKLIGFGQLQTGASGQIDRHIYMNNAGQIYFGVYSGAVYTVNSPLSYNDNNWHLATASISGTAGAALYVDGVQVGTNPSATAGENYTGYWRIGYDNTGGWTSQPASFYFNGVLDDALIYNRVLTAAEVNTIYTSSDGAGNSGPVCAGATLSLTAPTLSGATYAWTGPNGFSSSLQNPTLTYLAANAGTYTLVATVSGCSATAYTNVLATTSAGQWTGNVSTDWADANNWCAGVVPTATTNVTITSTATRMPSVLTTAACNSLAINAGATVTTAAAGTLNIAGTLTNNGTMVNSGTTNFNGTSGQQTFSGVTAFNNIVLNNTSGLLLPNAITANNITLTTGALTSNNFSIDVKGSWLNNSAAVAFVAGTGTTAVTFTGTTAQTIGGTYETSFNYVTASNAGSAITLTNNIKLAGSLVVGGVFDLVGFTANRTTSGGTLYVTNTGVLKIGGTNTLPSNYAANTFLSASTVEYSGTSQIVSSQNYGNLIFSSSAGAAVKTQAATAFSTQANLVLNKGAGTSVSFTPAANISIGGDVAIGTATILNGSSYTLTLNGNWANNGTFNGNTGTVVFAGASKTVTGAAANQNFNNVTISASGVVYFNDSLSMSGSLATTGSGSFIQSPGGTLTMTGNGATINGNSISIDNLTVTGSGKITASNSLTFTGSMALVNAGNTFTGAAGTTITLSGASKTISGAGTAAFNYLNITGSNIAAVSFSIASGLVVDGSFSATAGTATFTGTSTLSGKAYLFNTVINGTKLQLAANAILGVANTLTLTAGVLDVASSVPNAVEFNGAGAQNINSITYHNLILSNGNTKTAIAGLTINNDVTIAPSTTFAAGSFVHSIKNNWVNNGTFTAGTSTVSFTGTGTGIIAGATTFNELTINKTAATTTVSLQSNVSAAIVNMLSGMLLTGSKAVTITNTRTGAGIILGTITRTHSFATATDYAFEGLNNTVNFASLSGVTSVTVSVVKGAISDFPSGASISRVYAITIPAGTYNAKLRLHYEDDELNGNDEAAMGLWDYNAAVWGFAGAKTGSDATANYVEKSGLTNIATRWTLSAATTDFTWSGAIDIDWNKMGNWKMGGVTATRVPAATDVVNLGTAAFTNHPTIATTVTVKNILFGSVQPLTLSMATGGTLASGDITGNWSGNAVHTINANNQAIAINGNLVLSDGTASHAINVNIGNGTTSITGSLTQSGNANIIFTGTGKIQIGSHFDYTSGTFTAGAGTVEYNGTTDQSVGKVVYNNLLINNAAGLASIDSETTVNGNVTITSGELINNNIIHIKGNVSIASGTVIENNAIVHVGGNWLNDGTYKGEGANTVFDGTGTQTISATTFNNLEFNKPVGTQAILTGDVTLKGNLLGTSGTLDIGSYFFNRDVVGGTANLLDNGTLIIGADNAPNKFANYSLAPNSTVQFNGTGAQHLLLPGVTYGNITFSNSGVKTLYTPITVNGKLLIGPTATFEAGANAITLNGNWENNGTFVPQTSTVLWNGTNKTITGVTTFNKVTVTGKYDVVDNVTFDGLFNVTASGIVTSGAGRVNQVNADFTNSGDLYLLGETIFSGNVLQTLSLSNAVRTYAAIITFNGTVSPVLHSTSAPLFAILNINNTGGVYPSIGWTVATQLNVSSGASYNGGPYTQNLLGTLNNNGIITSSATFNFIPPVATAVSLNMGTGFSSTGTVVFGGAGAITLTGTPAALNNVTISNTNAAGVTPSSNWSMKNNFTINSGAVFNAAAWAYTVGGNISNSGTLNKGTSIFTLNGTGTQKISSISAFNNVTANKASGIISLLSNLTTEGTLNFVSGKIITGSNAVIQTAGASITGAAQNTGWVAGNLQKNVATGVTTKVYEIGDSANYTPVAIAFANVATAGNLLINTTATEHPAISSSVINADKSVNRFYTFTNSGIAFSNYTATFNFAAADIDAGADTAQFNVSLYNGSSWILPATAATRAASIQATGVTTFGDFAIGQICNKTTSIAYAASPYCVNAGVATVTLTGTSGGLFSTTNGLSINSSTGDVDLGASTIGSYVVTYYLAASSGCGQFVTNTPIVIGTAALWTGAVSTDWNNAGNWSCGGVPTAGSNVTIPSGLATYPIISTYKSLNDISIQNGASVTVAGAILQVSGTISNAGTFNATAGTIELNGASPQILPANTFYNNTLQNLIISNNTTLAGQQNITGTLSFTGNSKTLATGGHLTLRSTALGTARLADITNGGVNTGNTISGSVSIERYIPARRAWRLLSAPICNCSAPTINASWQEGSISGNPSSGYGVQITGGSTANGYDQGINLNPSLKIYNNSTNSFIALPTAPGTNALMASYGGYFLFVRGDRNTDLTQGVYAPLSPTTLRMKGQVNMGNTPIPVSAANVTLIGNPYPSAINFHSLTKSNVNDKLYIWDPKLAGSAGLGGYVTLVWNGSGYDATASVSPVSQYIPSGEAFFVETVDGINPGTITVKETDKSTGGSDFTFRPMGAGENLRVNLLGINADSTAYLTDGILTTYGDNNANAVDANDAKKIYNLAENICIGRDSKMLAIERRHAIESNDTTFLKLYTLKKQQYKLQLTTTGMENSGLYGVVKDSYAAANNNKVINMNGVTEVIFTVNADSASFAPGRFSIVFAKIAAPLPVTFTSVKAYHKQTGISVDWATATELNIINYEVEKSINGTTFTTANTTLAKANNGGSAMYSWLDSNAKEGMHYYRIKATGINGAIQYSKVANVLVEKDNSAPGITVFGNSFAGSQATLQFNNIEKGLYGLKLFSMEGQLIKIFSISHSGGSSEHSIVVDNYLAAGKYELQLIGKSLKIIAIIIKE